MLMRVYGMWVDHQSFDAGVALNRGVELEGVDLPLGNGQ